MMKMRVAFFLGVVLLLTGAMAVAQEGTNGYFATTPNDPNLGPWVMVQAGPFDNAGPFVDVASITIPAGKYLLTGRLTTFSYMGSASIDCAFMVNHATALYGDRLNGSGDGTNPGHDKSTFLGKYSGLGGVLTISCQKTYGATQWSQVTGTLTAVRVENLKSN
jgi:hypothetical protein